MRRQQPFSRHAGFFASLQGVEDRLASESEQQHQEEQKKSPPPSPTATATAHQSEASPFSDTMTASPLLFLDPAAPAPDQKKSPPLPTTATATAHQSEASPFSDAMTASPILFLDPAAPAPAPSGTAASRDSSGPALDFLTAVTEEDQRIQQDDEDEDDDHDGGIGEDIARLMALLGLSPPPGVGDSSSHDDDGGEGGCDCSGADGFLAKVVGVVGPKCDREKARLDAWIRHYHRGDGGGCREPARLAHLLLARASADTAAVPFPASVKDFLSHDPPRQLTDKSDRSDANGDTVL